FPAVADRLRRNLGHRNAVAGFPVPPPSRSGAGVSETRSPLRRNRAARRLTERAGRVLEPGARGRRVRQPKTVTRVFSGAALIVIVVAIVWFAPVWVFFTVAEAALVLAFVEYARLAAAGGTPVPAAV